MVQRLQRIIPFSATVALAGLVFVVSSAFAAFPLRVPQVAFSTPALQLYLNLVDTGITCTTDQLDAQAFAVSITGNTDFTLVLETGAGVASSIGVYNALDAAPALDVVFPAAAVPGWYATLHFGGGNLVVAQFDQFAVFQGSTTFIGVNQNNWGMYIQTSSGAVRYSQDFRNPGPQALTYGSNDTPGDYWECFEADPYTATASTFNDVVINIQSVRATPAHHSSWGKIKASYR